MNELANTRQNEISVIDGLAAQARALRLSINVNMWQLARVFIEAKELVPHGEWENWLRENAEVSVRTAQDMMAAYRRFGDRPQFAELGQSKTFKLLPLPEGTEDKFLAEHDVESMTAREVERAVKEAREETRREFQEKIEKLKQMQLDALSEAKRLQDVAEEAQQRAAEAENRPPVIPPELTEELNAGREKLNRQREEIERLAAMGSESIAEQRRLAAENNNLRREIQEQAEMLNEQQADLNRAQAELLNAQSAIAKGDAERVPVSGLTVDSFAQAVRSFIGTVARMPQMRMAFAAMDLSEVREYAELLETVERWCRDSRRALDTVSAEGAVI